MGGDGSGEGEGLLGNFEGAGVLGRVKAKPRADARSLAALASLDATCVRRREGWVLDQGGREVRMPLKIYPVVLDLVRQVSPTIRVLRSRSAALADQMERALISIPLNVAEGAYSRGKSRQVRYQSAAASARETLACLETAEAMGFIERIDPKLAALFDHVIGTLVRLIEPRR